MLTAYSSNSFSIPIIGQTFILNERPFLFAFIFVIMKNIEKFLSKILSEGFFL
ncbi:hypothetical protein Chls_175 [Chlamydia suis]|uniref:Uncharacterized protein n=1 Tax=Chlamydia suis TaxID=83559 RepID=A0ABX6IQ15_9CHLA|nr:hypothetical protein Chls_175 [Chlamydia suis]